MSQSLFNEINVKRKSEDSFMCTLYQSSEVRRERLPPAGSISPVNRGESLSSRHPYRYTPSSIVDMNNVASSNKHLPSTLLLL
jgi:hypothetical protein